MTLDYNFEAEELAAIRRGRLNVLRSARYGWTDDPTLTELFQGVREVSFNFLKSEQTGARKTQGVTC